MDLEVTHTLIIGAGPAGLACAACQQKKAIPYIILEKESQACGSWRNHYDRLHLHTSKNLSGLPYKKFGDTVATYPSRDDVVHYLEDYANEFSILPVFGTAALSIKNEKGFWITETTNGTYQSQYIIIASGMAHKPNIPVFKGIETFPGKIIHSSQYKNGKEFSGRNVLVVGFGNSAGEQAICLYEHGAYPALSVRSPVNVLPRDIFGIPVLKIGMMLSSLPPRLADKINSPLLRLIIGDIEKIGLKKSGYGPLEQIQKQKRIPLLDIGTIKLIKQGHIKVYGGIQKIEGSTVFFEDNTQQNFDAIIFATGYCHNLKNFLNIGDDRVRDLQNKITRQSHFGERGLYSCGFFVSPNGMLREIAIEAKKIARDIAYKQGRKE